MPVIAVNISSAIFEEIRALVDRGLYTSLEQVLEIAAFNQVALERGTSPAELVAKGHRQGSSAIRTEGAQKPAHREPKRRSREHRRSGTARQRRSAAAEVVTTEVLEQLEVEKLSSTQVPSASPALPRPADERVWGQVNRLFPIKLACRWLAIDNASRTEWKRLDEIAHRLADHAAALGSHLESLDVAAGRKRDDVLSTALPRLGSISSQDRFLTQFVARVTRASEIYPGALAKYAFGAFDADRVALTDQGMHLALLPNPLLDRDLEASNSTLAEPERDFLLQHIRGFLPGELADFKAVIEAVRAGDVVPDALLPALRPALPPEWTEPMVRTHLTGLVSRMIELTLLRRQWEGRFVRYELGPKAAALSE
jgi:hypothetical protein